MGAWNGIGGKIEPGEAPRESIIREIFEETGLQASDVIFRGLITWSVDRSRYGGMYTYVLELPLDLNYETPIKTPEGILDWKEIDWVMHPQNMGVATNIPKCLDAMLKEDRIYEHQIYYEDGIAVDYIRHVISEDCELLERKSRVEAEMMARFQVQAGEKQLV